MQQLAERERLQHPTPPPPRPRTLYVFRPVGCLLPAPDHAAILGCIPAKLQRPEQGVYGHRHTELLGRVHAQRKTGQGRTDGRGVGGGQGDGGARIASAEGSGGGVEEVVAQSCEEPEEQSVQEQNRAQRKRQSESGRLVDRPLLL